MDASTIDGLRAYLLDLQSELVAALKALDPEVRFRRDDWERPAGGGGSTQVIADGALWEKGGVNFSEVFGPGLPDSATASRPQLAGRAFRALGVSVVIHPRNPYLPTTHMNVRFFTTEGTDPVWWFGGGFDLTPYYPCREDVIAWHRAAHDACAPFGEQFYPRFKEHCDRYFHLPHRDETRGVGGLFFDDFNELGFEQSCALWQSIGKAFWPAYAKIVERHATRLYGDTERHWQQLRRGRYVEFNLLYDRGTLFGLQSRGRTESILMSLPPEVRWEYDHTPEPGSPEAELVNEYLQPRDWLGQDPA